MFSKDEMLSVLHRWYCCWKCQFDTDVKIENYNQHDGEQLRFLKKVCLILKKVHTRKQSKKKNVIVILILLLHNPLHYCKKRRIPIYLIKTVLKRNLKGTLFYNSTWRKLTWMNCNYTGKLQAALFSTYNFRKKLCFQVFFATLQVSTSLWASCNFITD